MAADSDSEQSLELENKIEAYDRISSLQASADDPDEVVQLDLGEATGLKSRNSIKLYVLPPNTRLQPPLAHSKHDTVVTVLSGSCTGVIWQEGWVYPFREYDSFGAKAGTGKTWTIMNAPHLLSPGEPKTNNVDLVILVAQENFDPNGDKVYYSTQTDAPSGDIRIWRDPPSQAVGGPYSGTADPSANAHHPEAQGPHLSEYLHAPANVAPRSSGVFWRNAVTLTDFMGLRSRFKIKWEVFPPGTKTSDAHAHKTADELVLVIEGNGTLWQDGETHQLTFGDVIGWPAGTGITHTIINDTNVEGQGPEKDLVLLVWGEDSEIMKDQLYYPLHPEKREKFEAEQLWWHECPKKELGPRPNEPQRPRTNST